MHRPALAALALLAFVGAFAVSTRAGEDDLVEKSFDVSTITDTRPAPRAPVLGSVLLAARDWSAKETPLDAGETPAFLHADDLHEMIRTLVEPRSWEETDGADVAVRDDHLWVRNRPEVVAEVEALLYRLATRAGQRVLLQVEMRDETPKGAGGCAVSGSTEMPFGGPRAVAVTNRVDYVSDYEVEIAQASNIADPVYAALEEGLTVEAVAYPLLDGQSVLLEADFRSCCLDAMRRVRLGVDEESFNKPFRSPERFPMGTLELPTCSHADGHVTLVVRTGEDVLVPLVDGERRATLRFHVEMLGETTPGPLIDVGAVTRPSFPLTAAEPLVWGPELHYRFQQTDRMRRNETFQTTPLCTPDELLDLLQRSVAPARWEEGVERLEVRGRSQLLVAARDDLAAQVRRFLAAQEEAAIRPVVLDLEVLSTRDEVVPGPGKKLDPELTTTLSSGRLATLSGRWASLRLGTTTDFLADYDVEVAQEARAADPQVGQAFGGLLADVRPHLPLSGSTVRVDLDLLFATAALEEPAFDTGAQYLGPVEQVRQRRTRIDTTVGVPLGGRTLLDAGPDPAHPGAHLVIALSAATP